MKFVIFCPDHSSGGPFALIQLNQALTDLGYSSEVLFYDKAQTYLNRATGTYSVRYSREIGLDVGFARYKTCTGFDRDAILVFPEVQLGLAKRFHELGHRRKVFWWLSWDNAPLGELNKLDNALALMSCVHMFQSEYARRKASELGFRGPVVSDWTLAPFNTRGASGLSKTGGVCFLSAKAPGSDGVIAGLGPHFPVTPIQGMTPAEVSQVLERSTVFLDFGHHPGKDRMPREAILHDCVPIVRKTGAAAVEEDCPIPESLKLDTRRMASSQNLADVIRHVQSGYAEVLSSLQPFRQKILMEKPAFYDQVRHLLALLKREFQ